MVLKSTEGCGQNILKNYNKFNFTIQSHTDANGNTVCNSSANGSYVAEGIWSLGLQNGSFRVEYTVNQKQRYYKCGLGDLSTWINTDATSLNRFDRCLFFANDSTLKYLFDKMIP